MHGTYRLLLLVKLSQPHELQILAEMGVRLVTSSNLRNKAS